MSGLGRGDSVCFGRVVGRRFDRLPLSTASILPSTVVAAQRIEGPGGGGGGLRWKPRDEGVRECVRRMAGFGHAVFFFLTWAPVLLLDMSVL